MKDSRGIRFCSVPWPACQAGTRVLQLADRGPSNRSLDPLAWQEAKFNRGEAKVTMQSASNQFSVLLGCKKSMAGGNSLG